MIDRPAHSVNAGVVPSVAEPAIDGLEVSADNVTRFGGDRQRYTASLASGLSAASALDQRQVRNLAAVAAWRAGVIGLRAAALEALDGLVGQAPAVGAVLGLPADHVQAFVANQATDRFFWPLWRTDSAYLIARVGGFVGLGGPWLAPPESVGVAGPGRWSVTADGSTWNVDVDLFGHAITPGVPSQSHTRGGETVTAALHTRPTSYLLDVVRTPS